MRKSLLLAVFAAFFLFILFPQISYAETGGTGKIFGRIVVPDGVSPQSTLRVRIDRLGIEPSGGGDAGGGGGGGGGGSGGDGGYDNDWGYYFPTVVSTNKAYEEPVVEAKDLTTGKYDLTVKYCNGVYIEAEQRCEDLSDEYQISVKKIQVLDGKTTDLQELIMKKGGSLTGKIAYQESPDYPAATIHVVDFSSPKSTDDYPPWMKERFTTTTHPDDGSFSMDNLPPGTYALGITPSDSSYAPDVITNVMIESEKTTNATAVKPFEVKLAIGLLKGRVTLQDGDVDQHGGSIVRATSYEGRYRSYISITQPDGGYDFGNIPEGAYILYVQHPGYRMKTVSGIQINSQTLAQQEIVLEGGTKTICGNITLSGRGILSGDTSGNEQVGLEDSILPLQALSGLYPPVVASGDIDEDGKIGMGEAIYGLQVMKGDRVPSLSLAGTLVMVSGTGLLAVTDSDGKFTIDGVPENGDGEFRYDLMVVRDGYKAHPEPDVVAQTNCADNPVVMNLVPNEKVTVFVDNVEVEYLAGSITGRTWLKNDPDPSNIDISIDEIHLLAPGTPSVVKPNAKGNYLFTGITPGTYTLRFSNPDYKTVVEAAALVVEDQTTQIRNVVMIPRNGMIRGRVILEGASETDFTGIPIKVLPVEANVDADVTGTGGYFSIEVPENFDPVYNKKCVIDTATGRCMSGASYTSYAVEMGTGAEWAGSIYSPVTIKNIDITPGETLDLGTVELKRPPEVPTGADVSYLTDTSAEVSWDASVSTDVAGYNIYYGPAVDQIGLKANAGLITAKVGDVWKYTIANLTAGVDYYFSVEAVDNDGLRSQIAVPVTTALIGSITGKVRLEGETDHGGAIVSVDGRSIVAVSSSDGSFLLSLVPQGTYTITASKTGFRDSSIAGIAVVPDQIASVPDDILLGKPPEPPTGLGASHQTSTSIEVIWTESVSTDVAGYNVYYGQAVDQINQKANTGLITAKVDGVWKYILADLAADVDYYFTVKAVDNDGLESEMAVPATTATAYVGNITGKVQLEGEISHGGIFVSIDGQSVVAVSASDGSFRLSLVPQGTYTITARVIGGPEAAVTEVVVVPGQTTDILEPIFLRLPPKPPTRISVAYLSSSSVSITWTESASTDVAGYNVYYGPADGQVDQKANAVLITEKVGGVWKLDITDLTEGVDYHFAVTAVDNDALESSPSIRGMVVSAGSITGKVQMEGETSHGGVLVSVNGESIVAVSSTDGSFLLSLVPGGTYTITASKVGFEDGSATGIIVEPDLATNIPDPILLKKPPEPPTGASVSYLTETSAEVTWDASVSTDVAGYNIYYGTAVDQIDQKANGDPVTSQVGGVWKYTVSNLTAGTAYHFAVAAVDADSLESELSAAATAALVGDIAGTVQLEGETSHGGVTVSVDGQSIVAQSITDGSFLLSLVPEGTYTITASKSGFESGTIAGVVVVPSQTNNIPDPILLKKPPEAATGLTAAYTAGTSVEVTWQASVSSDVAGYNVYYGSTVDQIDQKANVDLITAKVDGVWEYTVTDLSADVVYYFAVKAIDNDGLESALSASIQTIQVGGIEGFVRLEGESSHDNVTVSVDGTSISAQSSETGHFKLEDVPAGTHGLTAYKSGYLSAKLAGVEVIPNQVTYRFDVFITLKTPPQPPSGLIASQASGSSVTVEWTASTSTDVAGYNVYYGTGSDQIDQKANTELIAAQVGGKWQFEITGLSKGVTYYLAAESVDDDDLVSVLSQYMPAEIVPSAPTFPAPTEIMAGFFAFDYPGDIGISRDGLRAYVTNPYSNVVSLIDLVAAEVLGLIDVGLYPNDVVVNQVRDEVYSINWSADSVSIIDSTQTDPTQAVIDTLSTIHLPFRGLVSPDGKYLFVAGSGTAGKVSVIDLDTRSEIVESPIAVGEDPGGMAIANGKLYVANYTDNNLSVVDIDSASAARWSKFTSPIPVGDSPLDMAVRSDGGFIYVTNAGSDTVSVVDTTTFQVSALAVGDYPSCMATAGDMLYVVNYSGQNVSMINMGTNHVLSSPVGVGQFPWGVAVSADGETIYVVNRNSGSVSILSY